VPRIAQSDLALDLIDFIHIPASSDTPPLARINFLDHAGDGSGRLFVSDMRGKIYIIRNGALVPTPFLDVAAVRAPYFYASADGERGLISFAFHPNFSKRGSPGYGKFYTIHSERTRQEGNESTPMFRSPSHNPNHYKNVTEWTLDANNPDRIDAASRREILGWAAPGVDHGGGHIGFDPNRNADEGLLYISIGDGGNTAADGAEVEALRQAQNMMSPLGKILRINPISEGLRTYTIPRSNPFMGRAGVLPEIWASGLRNPETFSWDRAGARRMLIADIGQASVEEINLGKTGANYGWSIYEGEFVVDHQDESNVASIRAAQLPSAFTFPVAAYGHADGAAITGGFVYRGRRIPELAGKYIFGDLQSGAIFYADAQAMEAGARTRIFKFRLFYRGLETTMIDGVLGNDVRADLRFGEGEDGEIYLLTKRDGTIRKMTLHRD
jgi:glucose/arabinose dehydrogenase